MSFRLASYRALEHEEQTALFAWAKVEARHDPRLELLNSSQNGMQAASVQHAKRAKDCGMKKGFPDIALPVAVPPYHGMYIEMKRVGGKPSDVSFEQAWWLERLTREGYRAVVAYGWQDAVMLIEQYLNKKPAVLAGLCAGDSRLITTKPCEG